MKKQIGLWSSTHNHQLKLNPIRRASSGAQHGANDVIAYTVNVDVNLDALSPAARFIAERIGTTLRSGKNVRCYSRKTMEEVMREEGTTEDTIARIVSVYGPLDPPSLDWAFSMYVHDVSPEGYFEREAAAIAEISTHIKIGDDVFTFYGVEAS